MFKFTNRTIIYVICPAFNKTGGTELAHQLVYEINNLGRIAVIAYYDCEKVISPINPAFKQYVETFVKIKDIIDIKENIVVIPETKYEYLKRFSNIQKSIWWMSVDNYVKHDGVKNFYLFYGLKKTLRNFLGGHLALFERKIPIDDTIHFYQSEYAHAFLTKRGITNCYPLSDYINQIYVSSFSPCEKKDIVLYNPKKGSTFTKKLMEAAPELEWVPIQGLTTEEVRELLRHSKVYIDFGNHPGKDRFPREAAMSGCCVITDRKGSADFYEDIPILDEFKFVDSEQNINSIITKIKYCINDYEIATEKFEAYRSFIAEEYEKFKTDVSFVFNRTNEN